VSTNLLGALGFGLAFVLVGLLPNRSGFSRSAWLLRLVVPSYRFFELPSATVELEFRVGDADPHTWRGGIPNAERRFGSLFLDAKGTLRLYAYQLVDEFLFELAERGPTRLEVAEALPSFGRLKAIIEHYQVQELGTGPFFLRIRDVSAAAPSDADVLFTSTSQARSLGPRGASLFGEGS
jgi:hypothetical protein